MVAKIRRVVITSHAPNLSLLTTACLLLSMAGYRLRQFFAKAELGSYASDALLIELESVAIDEPCL